MQELLDENAALAFRHKNSMSESQSLLAEMEALKVKVIKKKFSLLNDTYPWFPFALSMFFFLPEVLKRFSARTFLVLAHLPGSNYL